MIRQNKMTYRISSYPFLHEQFISVALKITGEDMYKKSKTVTQDVID